MRLGIFGGSFDPVHNGHLALARACQQEAKLDEVWFMPTAVQPLKLQGPQASNTQRAEMLRLATSDEPTWRICTLEVDRGGPSYTIDTLRQLHEELPEATLFFLIGSDVLHDVSRWKEPREIFHLATLLVVHRAGEPRPDLTPLAPFSGPGMQPRLVEMPAADISSTGIRRRIGQGLNVDDDLPKAVGDYIAANVLYTTDNSKTGG